MAKRSVLKKQTVRKKRRKRKRRSFPVIGAIRRLGSGVLTVGFLVALVGGVSLAFLVSYQYLLTSAHLRLELVDVRGVGKELKQELIRMGGFRGDTSLLELRLGRIRKKMEAHPWVRSVRLERRFPNTLVVEAEPQMPVALVLKDKLHYLNRHGELFKAVGASEPIDFPIVTGPFSEKEQGAAELKQAARVVAALDFREGLWSADELSEIHVRDDGTLSLYFSHVTAEVRLMGDDLDTKLAGLQRVAEHLSRTGKIHQVSKIDLNHENGAVVSFRKG